jgi:hypothetical protein
MGRSSLVHGTTKCRDCLTLITCAFTRHGGRPPPRRGESECSRRASERSGQLGLNLLMLSMLRRLGYRASVFAVRRRGSLTESGTRQAVRLPAHSRTSGVRFCSSAFSSEPDAPIRCGWARASRGSRSRGGPLPEFRRYARDNLIEVRGTLICPANSAVDVQIGCCPGSIPAGSCLGRHEQDAARPPGEDFRLGRGHPGRIGWSSSVPVQLCLRPRCHTVDQAVEAHRRPGAFRWSAVSTMRNRCLWISPGGGRG